MKINKMNLQAMIRSTLLGIDEARMRAGEPLKNESIIGYKAVRPSLISQQIIHVKPMNVSIQSITLPLMKKK